MESKYRSQVTVATIARAKLIKIDHAAMHWTFQLVQNIRQAKMLRNVFDAD